MQVIRPDKEYVYANFMNGWGIIEYFYDGRQKTQEWISEVSFLAVPTCPSDLHYLEVEEIASGNDNHPHQERIIRVSYDGREVSGVESPRLSGDDA